MNYKKRISSLEEKFADCKSAEFVFKSKDETVDEAYTRGKASYPNAGLIIIVSWVSP